jgi:hypothetical protein
VVDISLTPQPSFILLLLARNKRKASASHQAFLSRFFYIKKRDDKLDDFLKKYL